VGLRTGFGSPGLSLRAVKIFADGSRDGALRSSLMSEPASRWGCSPAPRRRWPPRNSDTAGAQRFTPEFIEAARPCRHAPGDRWFVDETYVKVAGHWTYLYRAVDQCGQVIDVLLSVRRDLAAARWFFSRALRAGTVPAEVTTDRAPAYPRVPDELVPSALHTVEQYANNPIEADHGRLKARLRPMRGLKRHRSARIVAAGHAFVQNLRSAAGLASAPALGQSRQRGTSSPKTILTGNGSLRVSSSMCVTASW
jgi:transposase, IS6 family